MSSQTRRTGRSAPQQKTPIRSSAITMKHIAYLMRTNPKIKTENDAKIFLTKVQREHPNESINITKEGRIFSISQNGTITYIGKDGEVLRPFPRTSPLTKDILTQKSTGALRRRKFSGSKDETITELRKDEKTVQAIPGTSEAAKKARALFPHYDVSIDRERASALRPKKTTSSKTKDSRRIP